jgi:hypothetical protein
MDAKGKRRVITDMLDKVKADMLAAVDQMPDDWEETPGISSTAPSCSTSAAPRIACAASPTTTCCGRGGFSPLVPRSGCSALRLARRNL